MSQFSESWTNRQVMVLNNESILIYWLKCLFRGFWGAWPLDCETVYGCLRLRCSGFIMTKPLCQNPVLIQASIFLSDLNLIEVWQKIVLALIWAPGVFWNLLTRGLFLEVNFCIGVLYTVEQWVFNFLTSRPLIVLNNIKRPNGFSRFCDLLSVKDNIFKCIYSILLIYMTTPCV